MTVVFFKTGLSEIKIRLDALLQEAIHNVRPSQRMIDFYNTLGRLPLFLGTLVVFLTSIDAVRVMVQVLLGRTDSALKVIYEYRFRPWRLFWALGDALWQNCYNCRSARSRARFTQNAVEFLVKWLKNKNTSYTIVSLGSGSAVQLLRGITRAGINNSDIKIILVDRDCRALKKGLTNARRLGLNNLVTRCETINGFLLSQTKEVLFIEMVGVADYFKDKQLANCFQRIYNKLVPGGIFLGANINSQEEALFAHKVVRWPKMYYRSSNEIKEKLKNAGFNNVWIGHCGLYTLWVAQKTF